ncbi:MAG: hypothetical protein HKN29_03330 [Rhodothermales bacterium]|nr:hypothetical protein [Rhodothermales bacterium]
MMYKFSRVARVAVLTVLVAGCSIVDDAINDALPEIGISEGVLGLGGESGVELSGEFSDSGAADKAGDIQAVATFNYTKEFDDLDSGDINTIQSLATSLGMTQLTLNRGSAAALPDAVNITATSVSFTLSDSPQNSFSAVGGTNTAVTLTRATGCAATASSCQYTGTDDYVELAQFTLNNQAAEVFSIVKFSDPATRNTVDLTVELTVSNPQAEVDGLTATIRLGEFETTVTPSFS